MTRERSFNKVVTACALIIALLSTSVMYAGAPVAKTAAAPQTNPNALTITGVLQGTTTQVFSGLFDITRFANQNGQLVAIGQLTGTLTDPVTGVVQQVNQAITIPVIPTNASCEILDLQLGPLDLNLLGLMVHLDQINLNITAQAGPGNLLGNLLCAVAHLLDGGGPLGGLAGLLNNILRVLG